MGYIPGLNFLCDDIIMSVVSCFGGILVGIQLRSEQADSTDVALVVVSTWKKC